MLVAVADRTGTGDASRLGALLPPTGVLDRLEAAGVVGAMPMRAKAAAVGLAGAGATVGGLGGCAAAFAVVALVVVVVGGLGKDDMDMDGAAAGVAAMALGLGNDDALLAVMLSSPAKGSAGS